MFVRHCIVKRQGGCRYGLSKVTVDWICGELRLRRINVFGVCVCAREGSLSQFLSLCLCVRQPIIHDLNIYSFD